MATIADLSVEVSRHFLITVLESPISFTDWVLSEIPSFVPSKHAYASAANGEGTFLWITVFNTIKFPLRSHPTIPDTDLKVLLSYATSKWILTLDFSRHREISEDVEASFNFRSALGASVICNNSLDSEISKVWNKILRDPPDCKCNF
ncbi:hypothetical protein Godav_029598 [Gossypium davidsonii]|uniref:Uncharacterized protein n=1 Tax=Gossypium davidsonii TaxID=34287 RepID=A0A7J8T7N0_GOSDV|nr:hypothetical protein [Gossypium davidsonii]